ncbi:GAF domain-containing sensor histidine kinase [Streptomyces sp. So13.3]|uniref:sensor histidine kinase n=1 Tax=Streptomyces TaxID=1883 RepID=UPI001106617A|nr:MULTISPECIES: GAF domain-containing sensor histidine kinase [Streptomyces]QNA76498.1 GAF domain-containing sensor histidine kinase [Streptomyces sp. So13.3]
MGNVDEGTGQSPQLRIDELLEDLQDRLDAARGTRDQVRGLLEAVLSVGRELDLEQVLRNIVEAAAVLVKAEYAALGVIGPDGERLAEFVTVGFTPEQITAIGAYPSGHGILGVLIRDPHPLRLPRISDHPSSYGFPPNHPPMDSFLGVPIRVRDHVFGNLYLTEKRGGGQFDAEDESVLATLAVAAGVAIDNARLYEESRRRERWLQANAEITHTLMAGSPRSAVISLIAERAREITGAELALIALPVDDAAALSVELVIGRDAPALRGLVVPVEGSLVGAAFSSGKPVTSENINLDESVRTDVPRNDRLEAAVAVPIGTGDGPRGVLLLVRAAGGTSFIADEIEPLLGFAGQAAVAMELAERRTGAEQIALLEDRDRIARDLHDLAIQRLFATGMTLQSAGRFIEHPEASERVRRAVDDLDETIKIIRSTIFGLRSRETGAEHTLRARTVRAASDASAVLGFTPSVRMEGLLDTQVPREVADHAMAVLAESLSNVAKHAHATRVQVALETDGRQVVLTTTDNGVGLPAQRTGNGLRNMRERALQLGGDMELICPPDGGTTLVWQVPVKAE